MRALVLAGLVAGTAWGQAEVVEVKAPDAPARFEVTLQPVRVQVNGTFTQHLGTFASVSWSPRKHVALQVLGGGNWYNEESAFNGELVEKFRVEAQAATSILWTWGLFAGVELEPFLGELAMLQGPRVQLGFVLSVGAGPGGTRHQLRPVTAAGPASYGDTGVRFMATASAGLRLRVGERFIARLEVRDVAFSSAFGTLNGCTAGDLAQLSRWGLRDPGYTPIRGECRGFVDPNDAAVGFALSRFPSSDIIHNLGLALGAGFTF